MDSKIIVALQHEYEKIESELATADTDYKRLFEEELRALRLAYKFIPGFTSNPLPAPAGVVEAYEELKQEAFDAYVKWDDLKRKKRALRAILKCDW